MWSVRVRGREHVERSKVFVMVANHLSLVDVFAVHRLFLHFKWAPAHDLLARGRTPVRRHLA